MKLGNRGEKKKKKKLKDIFLQLRGFNRVIRGKDRQKEKEFQEKTVRSDNEKILKQLVNFKETQGRQNKEKLKVYK